MSPRIFEDASPSWFDGERSPNERACVARFLLILAGGAQPEDATPLPGDDMSEVAFIPGTDLVVTYWRAPELDAIYVECIEALNSPERPLK